MAKVIGDIVHPNGRYLKDGEEKTRWLKIGTLMESDKGLRIKLDCVPVDMSETGGWLSVFEKKNEHRAPQAQPEQQGFRKPAVSPADEDVPF